MPEEKGTWQRERYLTESRYCPNPGPIGGVDPC